MSRCKLCGLKHVFKKSECSVWGAICKQCHHRNHFAILCKNSGKKPKKVHAVQKDENDSSSDSSSVDYINAVSHHIYTVSDELSKPLYALIKVNKQAVKFQIDPGATINVIPRRFIQLSNANTTLEMWNGATTHPIGKCRISIKNLQNQKKIFC